MYNALGGFFSLYCVYKLVMATLNILFDRVARVDPITRGFEIGAAWVRLEVDVSAWSQSLALLLASVLLFTSVRSGLKKITEVFYQYSSATSSASVPLPLPPPPPLPLSLLVLLLAELLACYLVALVLLIRMSLPADFRAIISDALADIRFDFYHRWFVRDEPPRTHGPP